MSTDLIDMWHKRARPKPTPRDFDVQLGCHLEEILEMVDTLEFELTNGATMLGADTNLRRELKHWADRLKGGIAVAKILDREEFLDSICDQQVTGIGAGHCAGMNTVEAVRRVNQSNWSKYDVDGKPIFDERGKIAKGPNYHRPKLDGLY